MADSNNVDLQAWTDDRFFEAIAQLVMCHSPSGVEGEVNNYLLKRLSELGVDHWQDDADNIVIKIRGKGEGVLAITAHKDEIGGIVKRVETGGRLAVRPLGGAFPWVYGEGVVDLLGVFFAIAPNLNGSIVSPRHL